MKRACKISERNTPVGYMVSCACGWGRHFRRQNALARAAKVRKAVREHLESVNPVTPPKVPPA